MKKSLLLLFSSMVWTTFYAQWSVDSNINTAICTASNYQYEQQMVSDGNGGAILTWCDYNSASNESNIYAQRINSAGMIEWAADGIPICTVLGSNQEPQITADGSGGAIIAWQDNRITKIPTIYVQRIDASGQVQWTTNGISLNDDLDGQTQPQLISDNNGGAIITWKSAKKTPILTEILKAQRINKDGQLLWGTEGVSVSLSETPELPQIISDGANGAIISWNEWVGNYPSGSHDIYAQRINATGVIQWGTRGSVICSFNGYQVGAQLTTDGNNGAIISWCDSRSGAGATIYAQKISSSGVTQWATDGVIVATAESNSRFQNLISDGAGGTLITWNDNYRVMAQHLTSEGISQWGVTGKYIGYGQNEAPKIISDGSTGSIITWSDGLNILAQRLGVNGSFL
tara:strand:+ start:7607 stop:8812 length:1206 start_codon:yes stop_codon:yes gene_type:complete